MPHLPTLLSVPPFLAVLLALTAGPANAQSCEDRISDYERRIAICDDAARAATNAADAAVALGYKGEAERMLGRYDSAAATLRQALALAPAGAWYWTELGTVWLDSGDAAGAVAHYTASLELLPDDTYTRGSRAEAWRLLNAPDRCTADADRVLATDPGDLYVRLVNGRCLTDLGRPDAALGHIDQVIAAAPDYLEAYLAKMTALMALGRHAETLALADTALDPAISANASAALIEDLKALRLAASARLVPPDQLLAEAEALSATYPDNMMITNVRVWTLLNAGRVAEAETQAEPLRRLVGGPLMEGVFHDTLAQLDLAKGRTEDALKGFASALQLDPSLSRIYAKKLSEAGFLPLSSQPQNVLSALRRCVDAKGADCRVGA